MHQVTTIVHSSTNKMNSTLNRTLTSSNDSKNQQDKKDQLMKLSMENLLVTIDTSLDID